MSVDAGVRPKSTATVPASVEARRPAAKEARSHLLPLVAIVLIGLAIRLFITRGLWLDEATSVGQASRPYSDMVTMLRVGDIHPLFFQTLLWLDIRLLGTSELAVRVPSLVLGTITIPVIYFCARDLFDRNTALWAAILAAVAPPMVWYSQEARQYALFILLAAITIWGQVAAVRRNTRGPWIAYTVATAALMWTQYFSFIHILVQHAAFLLVLWRGRNEPAGKALRASWLRSCLGIVLLLVPLLPIVGSQALLHTQTVGDLPVSTSTPTQHFYASLSALISTLVGYHSPSVATNFNALWPLGLLLTLIATLYRGSKLSGLLVSLMVIPFAMMFVISLKQDLLMELRYFAGAIPALILLLARMAGLITGAHKLAFLLPSMFVVGLLFTLDDQQRSPDNARVYDYREILRKVESEMPPGSAIAYEPSYLEPVISYYAPGVPAVPLSTYLDIENATNIYLVQSLVFADQAQSADAIEVATSRLSQRHEEADIWLGRKIEVRKFAPRN